jgi:hypothetical protein
MKTHKLSLRQVFSLLFLLTSTIFSSCASNPNGPGSTSPSIVWAKCFGGSDADAAFAICHTADGGSIVVGATNSSDGDIGEPIMNITDLWIVKLTSDGMIDWKKKLGGSGADIANAVRQTADGGYIVAGQSDSKDGDLIAQHQYGGFDMWIMKLDYQGNTIWRTTHGGSKDDVPASVVETHDGNFVIAGVSQSGDLDVTGHQPGFNTDYWVIELDQNGVFVWEQSYGGTGDEDLHSIEETTDGFIITGSNRSNDGDVTGHHGGVIWPDTWIVKIDGAGNLQWQKSYGGTGWDEATGAFQTPDGGYIAVAFEQSGNGNGDVTSHIGDPLNPNCWILKLRADGSIEWQKSVGGVIPSSLRKTRDGGFVVSGGTIDAHGNMDMWIGKFNATADLQWQKTLGGSQDDVARSVDECDDGSYVLGGFTFSGDGPFTGYHGMDDVAVVKIKP